MGLFDSLENLGEIGFNLAKTPIALGRDLVGLVTDDGDELIPRTGKLLENTGDRVDELVRPNSVKREGK